MSKITCYGEVLWDIFPSVKKIGGAPLNVANRLASFGNEVTVISAVGNDELGEMILQFLKTSEVDTSFIQRNDSYATGTVAVHLDEKGSASYDIVAPVAWDYILLQEQQVPLITKSDAFVFGSLVCRHQTSKNTLFQLLGHSNFNVFDVNLRAPYYDFELLNHLMNAAHFIKFNDDEIFEISEALGSSYKGLEQNIEFIAKRTQSASICVTKGKHGAVLFHHGSWFYNSGYITEVEDTVGAGDSFLGTLLHFLLSNETPQKAIDYACAVGALVAGKEGANPQLSLQEITRFALGT